MNAQIENICPFISLCFCPKDIIRNGMGTEGIGNASRYKLTYIKHSNLLLTWTSVVVQNCPKIEETPPCQTALILEQPEKR